MSLEKIIVNIDPDLEELIPGFLENRIKDIEILKNAAGQADFEALKSVGHSLKGVGGGYGFARITELGAGIEASAKINDLEKINQLISDLADYLQRIEVKYQ
jgi:HPt (histidine-containing phosphotransfer) domain-containing protein